VKELVILKKCEKMSAFAKEIFDGTTATQFHGLLIVFWVVNF
jgi:hypothetical protein